MDLTVLGCGDAFGSGGRLQTSFYVQTGKHSLLLDCGATILPALHREGISSAEPDAVLITHFHGDHFGGLPFLLLEAAKRYQRQKPLILAGPQGLQQRLEKLLPMLYPGTEDVLESFPITYLTYKEGEALQLLDLSLQAWEVKHSPDSLPHGLRLEAGGKVLAFSGDTAWHNNLLPLSKGADLFICECNFLKGEKPGHLSWELLKPRLGQFSVREMRLTHVGDEVLEQQQTLSVKVLADGERLSI
ncbi:MBL fold metallo-hydrolase [Cesiribacter andamanensis]|uniref:Ribonuclease BN n=1 Tax=Cesiribacter andamanensis AMV16 TaxID=1279009 RepID=M7NKB0_9BACT|nr:MBL fold metallo-hydrolase [Cesiribacter andamanensis]EMR02210.1 Ribonuclease BN [Cesiribacter andamanensis AMV16]